MARSLVELSSSSSPHDVLVCKQFLDLCEDKMVNGERQFSSLRIDIESVLKPFETERQYLRK